MHLGINAVSVSPGGGMTVLLGLLEAWKAAAAPMRLTIWASRRAVIEAVQRLRPDADVRTFAFEMSSAKHFALQQLKLGRLVEQAGVDVLLGTQNGIERCRVPQVVHHQNLKRYEFPHVSTRLLRGQFDEAIKDVMARRSLLRAAANVFISDYLRREAERLVPESAPRNHTIHNGLPDAVLAEAAQTGDGWAGTPDLIAVQSTAAHKDNPTLIRCLARLVEQAPDRPWTLRIAGGGDWSGVRELAAGLGVLDRITFLGHLDWPELAPHIRRSACLVFTSVLEGFGLPLLEAMACRCPVVACNTTAMPEIAGDAGVLVPPGDAGAFADAVMRLCSGTAIRSEYVARGLERIGHFRWSTSAARMFALLEAAASGGAVSVNRTGVSVAHPDRD